MTRQWLGWSTSIVLSLGAAVAGAQEAPPASPPATEAAAPEAESKQAAPSTFEEDRTATVDLLKKSDLASFIAETTSKTRDKEVRKQLERLKPCADWEKAVLKAAEETRVGDMVSPSLQAISLLATVTQDNLDKSTALSGDALKLLEKKKPDMAKIDRLLRQSKIFQALARVAISRLDTFTLAIRLSVEKAPSEVRGPAFDAIAGALPGAGLAQKRLESLLRIALRNEADAGQKQRMESKLTELGISLSDPKPPAAPKPES